MDAPTAKRHHLQVTRAFYETLPACLKSLLTCRVVDTLELIVQGHKIEGLMMSEA